MNQETVVVVLYPGCISFEVALAAQLLSEKYRILSATPDGAPVSNISGLPLSVQMSYAQIDLSTCRAVLVPGGNPDSIAANREIDRVLVEAHRAGLLIGGICAGPSILGKAGILKGRKIAHGYGPKQLEFLKDIFKEVELTDELLVVDGNIVTAKPEAHIDFAVEIACCLGVVDVSQSWRLKEYYRGMLGRKTRPLALALLKNRRGQMLLHKAHDSVKKEDFYRPLGGGIEFFETGKVAVEREIMEEIGQQVEVGDLVSTFENLFVYEGKRGHEIVLLFETNFIDQKSEAIAEFDIIESGRVAGTAVWRSIDEIRAEGAQLYPVGIERFL